MEKLEYGYKLVPFNQKKSQCAFIQLDIMEFYPSIMETILDNALSFAKQHVEISDKDLHVIKH